MNDTAVNHPSSERLGQFVFGHLDGPDAIAIEEHLLNCSDCCAVLKDVAEQEDPFLHRLREAKDRAATMTLGAKDQEPSETWPAVPGYELLRELGRGGMGVVYLARHRELKRLTALKTIRSGLPSEARELERFRLEAETVALLQHPGIVQIYEVGLFQGQPFLALEYCGGGSLKDQLDGTPWLAARAAALVEQLAEAVQAAHQQHILHRDLKPANVLLTESGQPKVSDFGLAKKLDAAADLTLSGVVVGTPNYMAPEQARGEAKGLVPATDVYALGAILYELLTGRSPFTAASAMETIQLVLHEEPVPPSRFQPRLPAELETICLKCLEKELSQRYATAAELADELRRFQAGEPIRARPAGPLERGWKWCRRNRTVAALLAAVVCALLAGSGVSTYFGLQATDRANQAEAARRLAQTAQGEAETQQQRSARQAADLLLDRGLTLAGEGKVPEALHWMQAALQASPDPDFQQLVRGHLASWGSQIPALRHWLATRHEMTALSPDGRMMVTAGVPGSRSADERVTFQFWDASTGVPLGPAVLTADPHLDRWSFRPDGKEVLAVTGFFQRTQGQPGHARRWSVPDGKLLGSFSGHPIDVLEAIWSPDGRLVLTGTGAEVRAWDPATGMEIGKIVQRGDFLASDPAGRWALLSSSNRSGLWEIGSKPQRAIPLEMGEPNVLWASAAISPDAQCLLLGVDDRLGQRTLAERWDPASGYLSGKPTRLVTGAPFVSFLADGRAVGHAASQVSKDGRRFVRVADGIQVWEAAHSPSRGSDELIFPADWHGPLVPGCRDVVLGADRSRIWTAGGPERKAQAWELATGRPVGVAVPDYPVWGHTRLAVSPDGRRVASVTPFPKRTGTQDFAQIWDAETGQPLGPPLLNRNMIQVLAFSPDGKVLASGGHFHSVDLWDVATGQALGDGLSQGQIVMHMSFSPDGKMLAVGTLGREARLWDLATRKPRILPHPDRVLRTYFSPDSRLLLVMCPAAAFLWDTATGQPRGSPMPYPATGDSHGWELTGLFSPDGRTLLLSSGLASFRLWDTQTIRPLSAPTPPREKALSCFAFRDDGRLIVVGNEDGTAQVWDAVRHRPLGALVRQPLPVRGVAFQPDGRSFWTVAADGSIRSWPLPMPLEGEPDRIRLSLELSTGLQLDAGQSVTPLGPLEWQQRREAWQRREGNTPWSLAVPLSASDWHDARARDAEQVRATFTARWHLDRLIALRPDDWSLYARRARINIDEERWQQAEVDFRQALKLGRQEQVLAWTRHGAWVYESRGQSAAAKWHVEKVRALCGDPDQ